VEVCAAPALDRERGVEQIHQHGLAATDFAVEVEAFDRSAVARTVAEQPAERGRFLRQPMLREPRLERGKLGDDAFLARIVLDLARCYERAITLADDADHGESRFGNRRARAAGIAVR